ncbi:probable inactive poly [ADP-ribose] polymerase SRO3 [Tripterygium wilfordii]|uniref:probable inactive poly [ADP-ribose] polymerase SRO3 n=1 Tax=Tripterygium wilfordii TaxID=458696 RepID=UPI0018F816DA|nr:probable inactive poly [ADP-ribose] polymerase SRO3 [Tripterygium wilfordii]
MAASQAKNSMVESSGVPVSAFSSSSSPSSPQGCINTPADCCLAKFLSQNCYNFSSSAAPAKVMIHANGVWLNFPSKVLETFRYCYIHRKPVVKLSVDNSRYVVDFMRMLMIDFKTGRLRSIAWIDENGKCFFPKMFAGDDSVIPVNRIQRYVNESSGKRKRLDEEEEVSSKIKEEDAPKRQLIYAPGLRVSRWPNARLLGEGDIVYSRVHDNFLSFLRKIDPSGTVTAIHQCVSETGIQRARLQVFEKQREIIKAARGSENIVSALFAASAKEVERVLTNGFGPHEKIYECGTYGVGLHLSRAAWPVLCGKLGEVDDRGELHIMMCRVILGNVEKVQAGSRQSHPSSVDFDTGADDPQKPTLYVVWPTDVSRHIFPEVILSLKCPNLVRVKHSSLENDTLFSKLMSSLPPAKAQEVEALYCSFKAAKVSKDAFITQLTSMVGREVLTSATKEIQGSR